MEMLCWFDNRICRRYQIDRMIYNETVLLYTHGYYVSTMDCQTCSFAMHFLLCRPCVLGHHNGRESVWREWVSRPLQCVSGVCLPWSPGLPCQTCREEQRACRVITVCPAGALYSQTWRWLAAETRGTLTLTLTTSRVTSDRWPLTSSVGDICPDPCNLSSSARHPLTMSSEVRWVGEIFREACHNSDIKPWWVGSE